jgi:hypothetical protein
VTDESDRRQKAKALDELSRLLQVDLEDVRWQQEKAASAALLAEPSYWQLMLAVKDWAKAVAHKCRLCSREYAKLYADEPMNQTRLWRQPRPSCLFFATIYGCQPTHSSCFVQRRKTGPRVLSGRVDVRAVTVVRPPESERRKAPMRTRYQHGNLQLDKRKNGPDVWVYRWREYGANGRMNHRGEMSERSNNTPRKRRLLEPASIYS